MFQIIHYTHVLVHTHIRSSGAPSSSVTDKQAEGQTPIISRIVPTRSEHSLEDKGYRWKTLLENKATLAVIKNVINITIQQRNFLY